MDRKVYFYELGREIMKKVVKIKEEERFDSECISFKD